MVKLILPYVLLASVVSLAIGCSSYPNPDLNNESVAGPTVGESANVNDEDEIEGDEPQVNPETGELENSLNVETNANY